MALVITGITSILSSVAFLTSALPSSFLTTLAVSTSGPLILRWCLKSYLKSHLGNYYYIYQIVTHTTPDHQAKKQSYGWSIPALISTALFTTASVATSLLVISITASGKLAYTVLKNGGNIGYTAIGAAASAATAISPNIITPTQKSICYNNNNNNINDNNSTNSTDNDIANNDYLLDDHASRVLSQFFEETPTWKMISVQPIKDDINELDANSVYDDWCLIASEEDNMIDGWEMVFEEEVPKEIDLSNISLIDTNCNNVINDSEYNRVNNIKDEDNSNHNCNKESYCNEVKRDIQLTPFKENELLDLNSDQLDELFANSNCNLDTNNNNNNNTINDNQLKDDGNQQQIESLTIDSIGSIEINDDTNSNFGFVVPEFINANCNQQNASSVIDNANNNASNSTSTSSTTNKVD